MDCDCDGLFAQIVSASSQEMKTPAQTQPVTPAVFRAPDIGANIGLFTKS
jgi:hypothetical protein